MLAVCYHILLYQHNAKIPPIVSQNRTENEGIDAYSCYDFVEMIRFQAQGTGQFLPMRRVAAEATFDEELVGTVKPLELKICSQKPV